MDLLVPKGPRGLKDPKVLRGNRGLLELLDLKGNQDLLGPPEQPALMGLLLQQSGRNLGFYPVGSTRIRILRGWGLLSWVSSYRRHLTSLQLLIYLMGVGSNVFWLRLAEAADQA